MIINSLSRVWKFVCLIISLFTNHSRILFGICSWSDFPIFWARFPVHRYSGANSKTKGKVSGTISQIYATKELNAFSWEFSSNISHMIGWCSLLHLITNKDKAENLVFWPSENRRGNHNPFIFGGIFSKSMCKTFYLKKNEFLI